VGPTLLPAGANSTRCQAHDLPHPKLPGIIENLPPLPHLSELAAKPPQRPVTPPSSAKLSDPSPKQPRSFRKASMDDPYGPWNSPDVHKNHNHPPEVPRPNGGDIAAPPPVPPGVNGNGLYDTTPQTTLPGRTTSTFTTASATSGGDSVRQAAGPSSENTGTWGYYGGNPPAAAGFGEQATTPTENPFGTAGGAPESSRGPPAAPTPSRMIGGGRTGSTVTENILVTLMPEKEGIFMFQHHNYEVTSSKRVSKVIRRYSDFVWLLDCLHKRYPFRGLPLLPPKRVAGWSIHHCLGNSH